MTIHLPAEIGMPLRDVDTPALLLDLDAFARNLERMAAVAQRMKVSVRPHAKTHKCPMVALRQMAHGAIGQCAAKVGEAEMLVEAGIKDVLISNQIVGEQKLRRLAALARESRITVCVDCEEHVTALSRVARDFGVELGILIEIEVGMERCGVAPGAPALALARTVSAAPRLRFRGLQAYHGAAQHIQEYKDRKRAAESAIEKTRSTVRLLEENALRCEIVSGAGTGTFTFEGSSGVYTELQVGSYAFMDLEYSRIGGADRMPYRDFEQSLFVYSTVMSRPTPDRAILDAGVKAYSLERGLPMVHGIEDVEVFSASDEHGKVRLGRSAPPIRLGDKLKLIPGHCDPTINLHNWYVAYRNDRVEALWPIAGRGAFF